MGTRIGTEPEMMTGQQVCEYIASIMYRATGNVVNPEDIWNMSPTGELWPVFELYHHCKAIEPELDKEGK
jgi:hypothetical protein